MVVHIVKGRLAGMRKIIGHVVLEGNEPFPPSLKDVEIGDGIRREFQHAGTYPRYVLYREWVKPKAHRFGTVPEKENFDPRQA